MRPGPRAAALAALAALLAVPGAAAHAELLSSEPPAGARLDASPGQASVTLTEPVDPSGTSLAVHAGSVAAAPTGPAADCRRSAPAGADGRVDRGDLRITAGTHPTLAVNLPDELPNGTYVLAWQALSGTDGHTTSGLVGFAIGDAAAAGASQQGASTGLCSALGRALAYGGLALGLGAAAVLLRVGEPGVPAHARLARRALAAGAALHLAGVLAVAHATGVSAGLGAAELARSDVGAILAQRAVAGAAALALALLALPERSRTRSGPAVATLALAVAAVGSARLGHASQQGVAGVAADTLHLLASAAWVGGLALVLALLARARRDGLAPEQARGLALRFGTFALGCVLLLLAAGVATTVLVLGAPALRDPAALLGSAYGRVLAAKVALTLAMVALATANRFVFLAPAGAPGLAAPLRARLARLGPDGTQAGLRRTVAIEAATGAAVLVLAAVLTSLSPAVATGPAPLRLAASGDAFHYTLDIDPAPRAGGTSQLRLRVADLATGQAVDDNTCGRDSCVEVRIGPAGGAAQRHVLAPDGQGGWRAEVLWSFAGGATAAVRVQTADVFQDAAELSFQVA